MQAITLSRRDFREFDQIISFYTKERGRVEALARGVKKITSKNAAHLEPFSCVLVDIVRGKAMEVVTKVVPIDFFPGIRTDLTKALAASTIVTMVDRLVELGEPDKRIFAALWSWLRFVERAETMQPLLMDGFMVIFLSSLGFTPTLEHCVICGKNFSDIMSESFTDSNKKPAIYFAGGGIVCSDCRVKKSEVGEELSVCGLKEISDWQLLLKGDWRLMNEYMLEGDEYRRVHRLVYEFILYHSEQKIGDWARVFGAVSFNHFEKSK